MRNLLIAYGAVETMDDKDAWINRQRANAEEPVFLANFHRDDREG
jgi:hypothetical protein